VISPLAVLNDFADRHPVTTGSIGAGSGVGAMILREIHAAAGLAADLGMIFGCVVSFLTGVILIARILSWVARRIERRRKNMVQRRRHEADTSPEGDFDELVP